MIPFVSSSSKQQVFPLRPSESGRLPLPGGHDAERSVQGEEGAEAGGPCSRVGLHPDRHPQELDRPDARL